MGNRLVRSRRIQAAASDWLLLVTCPSRWDTTITSSDFSMTTNPTSYNNVGLNNFYDPYFNRFMLLFAFTIVSSNVILLKDKLKITNHNIYEGDDGPKNYDYAIDEDDIFGCYDPVGDINGDDGGVGYPAGNSGSGIANTTTCAGGDTDFPLSGGSEADDYGDDPDGDDHVKFYLSRHPLTWRSHSHSVVAFSSTMAEYTACHPMPSRGC